MNEAQVAEQVLKNTSAIAAQSESLKSAHKRINENDRITEGIHKLAANMEALTLQVKLLTERMDDSIERIEAGQKAQGERIGKLEGEPGIKWRAVVTQLITLAVAAVFGVFAAKLI